VLALALMAFRRAALFGFAGAVSGLATVTAAVGLPIPGRTIEAEAAILSTAPLLKYHVGTVLLAYACISLGAVASLMVLLARFRAWSSQRLEELDRAQILFAQLAAWLLAVGILLGAWWAHAAWGRWWAFDPKETWALLTWCVFLASIHLRNALPERFRPTATASLNLLGFLVMLWSWFGVNLLLTGLHSYA
jgi:ABC-type transport system involved in cytochrome c biogenesis permease subunit